jgi:hypothetical protein
MPEQLFAQAVGDGPPLHWAAVLVRLVLALALGRLVALVYTWTRQPNERTPSFPATLVLLSVLIAMVTEVIGSNIARAFSLVGALSIVRFRTVVRDTEDTAFVIFAVIIGMAAGAFNLAVASMGLVVVSVAAFWMRPKRLAASGGGEYALELRVGVGRDLKDLVGPVLDQHAADYRLLSVGTAKQGLSISASYLVRIKTERSADGLVQALNVIEGVQNVELTTPKDDADD